MKLKQLLDRRKYFNRYLSKLIDGKGSDRDLPNTCPGCGFPTLDERECWDICSICFWEDDGQDDEDADKIFGGPNGNDSLTMHRIKWEERFRNLKSEKNEIGTIFIRVDELIDNNKGNLKEILVLVDIIVEYFKIKRREKHN